MEYCKHCGRGTKPSTFYVTFISDNRKHYVTGDDGEPFFGGGMDKGYARVRKFKTRAEAAAYIQEALTGNNHAEAVGMSIEEDK